MTVRERKGVTGKSATYCNSSEKKAAAIDIPTQFVPRTYYSIWFLSFGNEKTEVSGPKSPALGLGFPIRISQFDFALLRCKIHTAINSRNTFVAKRTQLAWFYTFYKTFSLNKTLTKRATPCREIFSAAFTKKL